MLHHLYKFPQTTEFNKRITKNKLGIQVKPTARLRTLLSKHIERIDWTHLLAPHTLNLAATPAVSEINVLSLKLHTPNCPDAILAYLDKAIPKPTLFELTHQDQLCLVATYKRPSRSRPAEFVTYDYYRSGWIDDSPALRGSSDFRQNLPHALNLEQLYGKLLSSLLPNTVRAGESLDDSFGRAAELSKMQRELEKLKKRHQREKQFNLRIELNARIHALEGEIDQLSKLSDVDNTQDIRKR